MTDAECRKIEMLAMNYLIRCSFEDLAITTLETSKALKQLGKELRE